MDLRNLIESHLDLARLSSDLDGSGHFGRLWSVRQWTRRHMAVLWEAARDFRRTTLDDLVPSSIEPLVEVIHHGKNSLPVASHFEKRFCRLRSTPGEATALAGFNEQAFAALTGPGYFVARPAPHEGEVAIDYTMRPPDKAPSWPPIQPSSVRLGRWVYGGAIDVVRGLSSHVTIGRVQKKDVWKDTWFVLVRRDP